MRKIIPLSLIAVLLLFSGCAAVNTAPATTATIAPVLTDSPAPTLTPTPSPSPTPTLSPTPSPTVSPTAAPIDDTAKQMEGTFNGDAYTNDYLGFTMTKGKSYTVAPMDEAQQAMQSMSSTMGADGTQAYISFMLMSSSADPNKSGIMMLLSAKLDDSAPATPKDFLKELGKVSTVKIDGMPFSKASMSISISKIKMTQTYYCIYQKGYMLLFILTSTDKTDAAALEGMMKTIKFK